MSEAVFELKSILKVKGELCTDLDVKDDIIPIAFTVDGTWRKRYEYSSWHGVVFVMAAETKEVIHYEVRSKSMLSMQGKNKIGQGFLVQELVC